jgi:hypothetical protein
MVYIYFRPTYILSVSSSYMLVLMQSHTYVLSERGRSPVKAIAPFPPRDQRLHLSSPPLSPPADGSSPPPFWQANPLASPSTPSSHRPPSVGPLSPPDAFMVRAVARAPHHRRPYNPNLNTARPTLQSSSPPSPPFVPVARKSFRSESLTSLVLATTTSHTNQCRTLAPRRRRLRARACDHLILFLVSASVAFGFTRLALPSSSVLPLPHHPRAAPPAPPVAHHSTAADAVAPPPHNPSTLKFAEVPPPSPPQTPKP